jgi:hypothetical protein
MKPGIAARTAKFAVRAALGRADESGNIAERNTRVAKANQTAATRQFYLFQAIGIGEPEPEFGGSPTLPVIPFYEPPDGFPFYEPPEWFRPYLAPKGMSDDCPF